MCISSHMTLFLSCIKMCLVSSENVFSLIIQLKVEIWKTENNLEKDICTCLFKFSLLNLASAVLEWSRMRNNLYSCLLLIALKESLLGLAADGFIARDECACSWLPVLYAWSSPSQCFMCLINCGTGRSTILPKYMPFSLAKANIMKRKHLKIRSTVKNIFLLLNSVSLYRLNSY